MAGDAPLALPRPPSKALWRRVGAINGQLLSGASRAAWRSIRWSLDAWGEAPARSALGEATSVSASWLEATRSWTEALARGSRLLLPADASLLAELAEGLARAFRGRRVEVELSGRRVRAELDSIWLDRHHARHRGRLELRNVRCDGLEVETLSVIADAVALTLQPNLALMMSGVELHGRSALLPLIAWLNLRLPDLNLSVAEDDLIEVVSRNGDRWLVLDGMIRDGELEVELRRLRWSGVTLRCPRWLRLTRKLRLPVLPYGLSITEAIHREAGVDFRLSMPAFRHSFEPGRVREAILSAESIPEPLRCN